MNILPEVDHHVKLKNIKNFLMLCLTLLSKHSHLVSFGVFVTLWTVAHQDPLSMEMEFSRQKYWSGLSFPSPKGCVASPSGNRTWVSHVTGRDTQNYTNKDSKTPLFPKHLLTKRLSVCFQRTFLGFTLCLVFWLIMVLSALDRLFCFIVLQWCCRTNYTRSMQSST